mgnify:CR=1 FL=1
MLFKGPINANDFGGFIVTLLLNYREIANNLNKYVIYLDNAPIHRAYTCINKLTLRINFLYGPPYTP